MVDPNVWTKFFILLVGVGIGFCIACLASAKIVAQNCDLKKQLEKVRAERNLLLTLNRQATYNNPNVKIIELPSSRHEEQNYFHEF